MGRVLKLTLQMLSARMSKEEKEEIPEELRWERNGREGAKSKLSWLYTIEAKSDVKRLLEPLM
jgi:hypothetical protein